MKTAGIKNYEIIASASTSIPLFFREVKTLRDLFDLNITVFGVSPEEERKKLDFVLKTGKVKRQDI